MSTPSGMSSSRHVAGDIVYPSPVFPSASGPEDSVTRNLIILVLDTSGSMSVPPRGGAKSRIDELQEALDSFFADGMHDIPALEQNGEIAVATFSNQSVTWLPLNPEAEASHPFYFARYLREAPRLTAYGETPMGQAVENVLDTLAERKRTLRTDGLIHEYRPNVFLLSDGMPSDDISQAAHRRRQAEDERQLLFFALGAGDANDEMMRVIARPEAYYSIKDKPLHAYIEFLSRSLEVQQSSVVVETVDLTYERVRASLTQNDAADMWAQE